MRILMLSKACIVGIYQTKLEAIAHHPDVSAFKVIVPPYWQDERGRMELERMHVRGYELEDASLRFNGSFHLHYYPDFFRRARDFRPDVIHIDEEPYNLATWHAMRAARGLNARTVVFSWQNINRRYPPPFRWGERWVLRSADHLIAGTESAAAVWRQKGYQGPLTVIPQFGVDPALFPLREAPLDGPVHIGFVGRLVHEKGADVLLDALAQIKDLNWQASITGGGPQETQLRQQAAELDIEERVRFIQQMPSGEIAAHYRQLDVLALPSRTRPNWKEQFGRVLIEAMASGAVVVGSDCGAIPDVIGEAGLIFPEGNVTGLANHLRSLITDSARRKMLVDAGRRRALEHFSQERVARQTVEVYRQLVAR